MAKLTKAKNKLHNQALELLKLEHLTDDDKIFILDNWHEATASMPNESGAFFTPFSLANDFAIDAVVRGRVLDICAGIGSLSLACKFRTCMNEQKPEFTCVEINPKFVEIGKRIMPEATWICADVRDLAKLNLGKFDNVISNPPFGSNGRTGKDITAPRYTGSEFEFKVMDIVADMADYGAFIIPQSSSPFRFSGQNGYYQPDKTSKLARFEKETGLVMEAGCGIDTHFHRDLWKSTNILTEVCTIDFEEWRKLQSLAKLNASMPDLFSSQKFV